MWCVRSTSTTDSARTGSSLHMVRPDYDLRSALGETPLPAEGDSGDGLRARHRPAARLRGFRGREDRGSQGAGKARVHGRAAAKRVTQLFRCRTTPGIRDYAIARRTLSTARRLSAARDSVGFAVPTLGQTALLMTKQFVWPWSRSWVSTTDVFGSVPMRQVPMMCPAPCGPGQWWISLTPSAWKSRSCSFLAALRPAEAYSPVR